jgi:TetR/AcrR family transcriptional repressor of bet genes
MPKLGMGPIRRKQLVAAAVAVIHERGFARATVARIARQAGVSSGIVHHYFEDKDALLFATMRALLAELRRESVARLARAAGPAQRIVGLIEASFADSQFDEQVFSAWLALYGNARHSAKLQRILLIYHARLRSNLVHDLKKLVGHERAPGIADGIAAMIDGLWLRYALTGKPSHVEEPRTLTRAYLWAVLGRDRVAPSRN